MGGANVFGKQTCNFQANNVFGHFAICKEHKCVLCSVLCFKVKCTAFTYEFVFQNVWTKTTSFIQSR